MAGAGAGGSAAGETTWPPRTPPRRRLLCGGESGRMQLEDGATGILDGRADPTKENQDEGVEGPAGFSVDPVLCVGRGDAGGDGFVRVRGIGHDLAIGDG